MATAFCPNCKGFVHVGTEDHRYCPRCASPLTDLSYEYEPEAAAHRIAENEAIFREANERIKSAADGRSVSEEKVAFICECGQRNCHAAVTLTLTAYERVRKQASWFFTLPGHEMPGIETIIETADGYQVIEKLGPARRIVEETDPRQ